jgi:hypothetical protein
MRKRYSPVAQGGTVARWLVGEGGRRPSEAAIEAASMTRAKLRQMHRDIVTLLEAGELEQVRTDQGWVIRKPAPAATSPTISAPDDQKAI